MRQNILRIAIVSLIFGCCLNIAKAATKQKKLINSIVKVYAVNSRPNYHQPWQNYPQSSGTGSGCVIPGNRILTNAHVCANSTFVMVRRHGDTKKYVAKAHVIGHECDLAILTVNDPNFFLGLPALELGDLPQLQETVSVMGYPVGGDNISITEGVVSRIEPTRYSHSGRNLLAIQIDAAINPGNSGGPVIKDGKIVGVAFQGNTKAENMGFVVPASVIKHFFKDVEDDKYDGFPSMNISIGTMENPDLRKWAKMKPDQTGVMITYLPPLQEKRGFFKMNDVIMAVDDTPVANDGTVPFRGDEVIFFGQLIWKKYIGEKCKFKLLREGKTIEIDYPLSKEKGLVPDREFERLARYYIVGGLLFVPLTQNYLDAWGGNWRRRAPLPLVNFAKNGKITEERNEVVVLSKVLADDINVGYQNTSFTSIKSINGKPVKNLKDLIAEIEGLKEGFIEVLLEGHSKIVLDIKKAREVTPRILERYRIPSDRSKDL